MNGKSTTRHYLSNQEIRARQNAARQSWLRSIHKKSAGR